MHRLDVLLLFLRRRDALEEERFAGGQQLKLLYQQVLCFHIFRAVLYSFLVFFGKCAKHHRRPATVFQSILVTRRRPAMIANSIDIPFRRAAEIRPLLRLSRRGLWGAF